MSNSTESGNQLRNLCMTLQFNQRHLRHVGKSLHQTTSSNRKTKGEETLKRTESTHTSIKTTETNETEEKQWKKKTRNRNGMENNKKRKMTNVEQCLVEKRGKKESTKRKIIGVDRQAHFFFIYFSPL